MIATCHGGRPSYEKANGKKDRRRTGLLWKKSSLVEAERLATPYFYESKKQKHELD
jgi:hypothetical protein